MSWCRLVVAFPIAAVARVFIIIGFLVEMLGISIGTFADRIGGKNS